MSSNPERQGWPDDSAELAKSMLYWRPPPNVWRAYADSPFGQLHFRYAQPDVAQRTAVVFLHQTPSSGRAWEGVVSRLGETRVAIAPDTPGYGDSDGPAAPPSITEYAEALAAFIADLGLSQVDLVGDHTGAKVAAEIARLRPTLVRKLVLYGAPVYSDAQRDTQRAVLAEKERAAGAPLPEDGAFLVERWGALRQHYDPAAPLALVDRDFAESLRAQDRAWWGYKAAYDYDHSDVLPSLGKPMLFVSANDGLWEETHRAAKLVPDSTLVHRAEWRVGAISQHADVLSHLIQQFLDDEPPREQATIVPPETDRHDLHRLFASSDGGQIHLRAAGRAADQPPLFCFHMSPRSSAYLEALIGSLSDGRQVLAPDTPGYGESFKPEKRLEVPDYARLMGGMIDGLGFSTIDLLGDHTGTKIAIELARQRPDLVRRIVMSTAGVYSAEEQKAWQSRMGTIEVDEDGGHYAALWERYLKLNRGKLTPEQNAFRFHESVRAGPCMWWGPRAANMYILGDILPQIEQEIFLACSDEDSLLEPTRRGAKLLHNGCYREYAGLGNSMLEYRVGDVAGDIDGFLRNGLA